MVEGYGFAGPEAGIVISELFSKKKTAALAGATLPTAVKATRMKFTASFEN
jgi:hypothetical protein